MSNALRQVQVSPLRRSLTRVSQSVSSRVVGKKRPKVFYATVSVAGTVGIIVTQIILSVWVSSNAFEIDELQTASKEVTRSSEQVQQHVSELSSPQNLAQTAEALGMVSSSTPAYLRLSDALVLGQPSVASSSAGLVAGSYAGLVPNSELAKWRNPAPLAGNVSATSVATTTAADASVPLSPSAGATIPVPQTR